MQTGGDWKLAHVDCCLPLIDQSLAHARQSKSIAESNYQRRSMLTYAIAEARLTALPSGSLSPALLYAHFTNTDAACPLGRLHINPKRVAQRETKSHWLQSELDRAHLKLRLLGVDPTGEFPRDAVADTGGGFRFAIRCICECSVPDPRRRARAAAAAPRLRGAAVPAARA